eukprot:CAMPEP_0179102202 /NCGR_PEP_ID=MMETSP0796-20121207/47291_1 /TAXON_ID=73915 /ORGANISM="Pyrodinium bahamense, Strain pbaha01" /LENGTH=197 /DNA_ID=CAMNT_0020800071 /DNA_START=60 /DNA_END=653 /DNA_ORIENTATION=+
MQGAMDEKMFECIVCLEMCHECINCEQCHQILCKRHVRDLPEDRCPACRASPFRFRENVALQRIIDTMRQRLGIPTPSPSPREASAAQEDRSVAEPAPAAAVLPPHGAPSGITSYGRKLPCPGRDGQFMKLPSTEHAANMRAHVRSCALPCCQTVWSGPWGSFIGGPDGRTHFDLTDCDEGKRLNLLIGWNYDDPSR